MTTQNSDLSALLGQGFFITTLGCKVNQHESELMSEELKALGMHRLFSAEGADVIVINSCTVTSTADQKTRQTLSRMRRTNPRSVICLTGCVPQAFPEKAAALAGADIVIGNSNREKLPAHIAGFLRDRSRIDDVEPHGALSGLSGGISDFGERTRSYIKIEDGCNRFCAYCIIPYARGRVRSRRPSDIVEEATALAQHYREVVLVGINLSAYGQDCGLTLVDAVKAVAQIDGIDRIRLGSVEPDLLSPELLSCLADEPKFCPQFHMSLQSGCDRTLERMRRHYDSAFYMTLVKAIRERFDNPSITTDVMVGFAGETEDEFCESLEFVKSVGFARVHCFAYSRREGTAAFNMPDQVSPSEKSRRSSALIEATDHSSARFLDSQIGTTAEVLVERELDDGSLEGYSRNYTPVRFSGKAERGEIVRVLLTGVGDGYCIGAVVS